MTKEQKQYNGKKIVFQTSGVEKAGYAYAKKKKSLDTDIILFSKINSRGFPGGAVVENLRASAGNTGSSPGLGRSHVPRSN